MANLKDLKGRIGSIKNTQQITKAVKMIAANKLKQSQRSLLNIKHYKDELLNLKNELSFKINTQKEDFSLQTDKPKLLIVISSNRGLAGGFNNNIIRESIKFIKNAEASNLKPDIVTIGSKARDFFNKSHISILNDYSNIFDNLNFNNFKDRILPIINTNKYSEIIVIYNKFKSAALQIVDTQNIYPLDYNNTSGDFVTNSTDYILEPSKDTIMDNLDSSIILTLLYHAIISSFTSEQAARMITMDQATENANNLLSDLTLEYNQIRQSIITNEILEISAAAKALK
ncbi:MAG: ATP synthase F1 subunit gamma [Solitalea-like symbiont of Tyrophagus putrescentiae]